MITTFLGLQVESLSYLSKRTNRHRLVRKHIFLLSESQYSGASLPSECIQAKYLHRSSINSYLELWRCLWHYRNWFCVWGDPFQFCQTPLKSNFRDATHTAMFITFGNTYSACFLKFKILFKLCCNYFQL